MISISLNRFNSIIITGANGWLGRRLVKCLISGIPKIKCSIRNSLDIRCLVQEHEDISYLKQLGVHVFKGDVRNSESINSLFQNAQNALLIHIAGVIHPKLFTKDFFEINFMGTKNILEAAKKHSIARFIAISSNSPFGFNNSESPVFTENSPYNPYMGYGKSKWQMELMIKENMSKPNCPETAIMRPPWFYGPEQPVRQTTFFTMIKNGHFPIIGNGENKRSMGYLDNLVLGILLCATSAKAKNNIYWIADEKPYSMKEIVNTVLSIMKSDFGIKTKNKILKLPDFISDFATIADYSLQKIGLYNQKIHVLSEMNQSIVCDISKAKEELGYTPIVSLREGMKKSIEWCLEENIKF